MQIFAQDITLLKPQRHASLQSFSSLLALHAKVKTKVCFPKVGKQTPIPPDKLMQLVLKRNPPLRKTQLTNTLSRLEIIIEPCA
jgi:hypothetical protein